MVGNVQMIKEAGIEALREKPRHSGDRTISVAPMMDWTDGYGIDMDIKKLGFRDSEIKDHVHPGAPKRNKMNTFERPIWIF